MTDLSPDPIDPSFGLMILPGLLSCRDCTLSSTRRRVVPGFGTYPSRVMFVAQSPGEEEDRDGKPLVGRSGQLLTNACKQAGWDLNDLYKTNVNHCHPPENRKATGPEIKACRQWLTIEIAKVDPDLIICLGDSAFRWFMPEEKSSITQVRGNIYKREVLGRERMIMPTVHPAFVLRNVVGLMAGYVAELKNVRLTLEGKAPKLPESIPFRKTKASWDEIMDVVYAPDNLPFGFDLETDRLGRAAGIVGVGVCNEIGNGLYYPFQVKEEAIELMQDLKMGLEDPKRIKIVSNAKFERHICESIGITIKNYRDTMVEAWLLGDHPLSLKDGIHHAYGIEMIRIDKFKRFKSKDWRGENQLDMRAAQDTIEDEVVEYAAQDPDASLRLHLYQAPKLAERSLDLSHLYTDVELPFTEIIVATERAGIAFDPSKLAEAKANLEQAQVEQTVEQAKLIGKVINVNAYLQVRDTLYFGDHPYVIPKPKKRRGHPEYPTDRVSLGEHIDNPLVRNIFTIRGIRKMLSTYIDGLPTWIDPLDGRIHPECKQTGTETGRVSYANPNLQNIPARKRDDVSVDLEGATIRKGFVASRPDHLLYAPDLSQIEMRMAAHLSDDENMIRLITEGMDIHDNTTTFITGKTEDEMLPLEWKNARFIAKTVGFGTLYGIGEQGVLMRTPTLKLTLDQARRFIDGFYGAYPGILAWQEAVRAFTRRNGYAETILGRRRYLPNITASDRAIRGEAERAAINVPVQGSAADYFKLCILSVHSLLQQMNLRTKIILQVHDEIVLEGPESEYDVLATEVFPIMTQVYPLKVPVKIDVEAGRSWGSLISYKKYKEGIPFAS